MSSAFLTKSKFASGWQCEKRLWLAENRPEIGKPPSLAQKRLFELGRDVGVLARAQFPGGVLIEGEDFRHALRETERVLTSGADILYEPTFAAGRLGARIDVLRRLSTDRWEVIEVKMSTKVKDEHIPDVAFQREVLERAGLRVERATLMHINNQCVYPDLDDLFATANITALVEALAPSLSASIDRLLDVLADPVEADVRIGSHCEKPYECPFKDYCWANVPAMHSVFSVPRLPGRIIDELVERDILHATDIPDEFLTPARRAYVELVSVGQPRIAVSEIRQMLSALEYPIHFFDFESINPPIPRFNGTRPYLQVPFQFSCHSLQEDGELIHRDFLHTSLDDPRQAIAERLLDALGDVGSVVVYHQSFEEGILKKLAEDIPSLRADLLGVIDRLWDLVVVFRKHYAHPDFNGSNSIKDVLPVLVPDLRYDDLYVTDGTEAQALWEQMIRSDDERLRLEMALRDYCRMDTLAMVRLFEHLQDLLRR